MNEITETKICFEQTDLSPESIRTVDTIENSAINAAAIVTGKKWTALVRSLIEQAHIRGNMPTYKTCLTDMLRANGFMSLTNNRSLRKTLQAFNETFSPEIQYIIKLGAGNYCALVPDKARRRYVFKGFITGRIPIEDMWIEEIWKYVPGTDNRTGIRRKARESTMPTESKAFAAKNMNPEGRMIGDCVIRALSAAYECSWHEAIDHIAEATNYEDPLLNSVLNINTTLIKLGFERRNGIMVRDYYLNGKQLCNWLNSNYHDGERIFAYVGRSHCAAIIPIEENGSLCYKVQDTWDSTKRGITEFWVYRKPKPVRENPAAAAPAGYNVGEAVVHPKFGEGIITAITGESGSRVLEISFGTVGIKRISEAWLRSQTNE